MPTDRAPGFFEDMPTLKQCNAYILTQLEFRESHPGLAAPPSPGPAITISHQAGSGAHEIAIRLAGFLQAAEPQAPVPWTVFDRNLVEKVLEDHHLSQTLAKFIPEDSRNYIQDAMVEMMGMVPPSWDMVPQIASTVMRLADAGHVILVGRGASFITSRVPHVFHVRLIASLPKRIQHIQQLNHLTQEEAAALIKKEDRARGRYVKSNFHVGIDDDLLYHLIINTDLVPCADAVRLIADGMRLCTMGPGPGR